MACTGQLGLVSSLFRSQKLQVLCNGDRELAVPEISYASGDLVSDWTSLFLGSSCSPACGFREGRCNLVPPTDSLCILIADGRC